MNIIKLAVKMKVKFTLEQAMKVQNGESKYNCTLSLTSALDGCGSSMPRPGHFTPGNGTAHIVQEAEWALEPVWTGAENLAPNRFSNHGTSSP
jgi:hypothetical protein